MIVSKTPGSPATMTFGRPVDPPEVGAFHAGGAGAGGGGVSGPVGEGVPASTTAAGSTTSRIAAISDGGSRWENGWGTAPSFHAARVTA